MEKKITKKEMFTRLLTIVEGDDLMTDFIKHEIELLDRKKSSSKLTKNQTENLELMDALYDELSEIGKAVTITEFQKASEYASQFSHQKISALFKLMDNKRVEKTVVKGRSYFKAI